MKKYTQKQLEGMTSSELLAIYNEHAEKPLAKFQDKASAVERTFDVLPDTKEKKVGPCAIVWATADSMPGAARKDVLAACVEQGINKATASTQYQKWKVNHENN